MSRIYLLELENVDLVHEAVADRPGELILLTSLIAPRPAIRERSDMKVIAPQKGKASYARRSFAERVVFKERVEGPFGIRVAVTLPDKRSAVEDLIRSVISAGVETAGHLALAEVAPLYRTVLRAPLKFLSEEFDEEETPDFVAEALVDVNLDDVGAVHPETLVCELKATERIQHSETVARKGTKGRQRQAKTLVRKGETIAQVSFRVTVI